MKIRIVFTLLSALAIVGIKADLSGPITSQVVSPGSVEYSTAFWYSASASYVNGGLTFTFPTNLFLQTPTVTVSVLNNGTYSALTTITTQITALSSTSVTVRVNSGTILSIGEAPTDFCTIQIWAVGTEN